MNQFSRTELLIGAKALDILQKSHVAVFGVGGVGGYAIEALIRAGIGKIDIIDNDKVSLTNLNRQIIALHSTIGQYKVDVMEGRILDINPNAEVCTYKTFFNQENSSEFDFKKYDYVVDAIDSVKSKLELIECAKNANTPIISAMGAGNKLDANQFFVDDIYKTSVCPLARVMRTELKKRGIKKLKVVYSKEIPAKINYENLKEENSKRNAPASISYAPSSMGLIIANVVIKDLIDTAD